MLEVWAEDMLQPNKYTGPFPLSLLQDTYLLITCSNYLVKVGRPLFWVH
jgi:hypothetical protein